MKKRYVLWVVTLLWAMVIFCFSAQPAKSSEGLSRTVTAKFVNILPGAKNAPAEQTRTLAFEIHNSVRNVAHFILYAVFGFLVVALCMSYRKSFIKAMIFSLWICALYAVSDEIHQLFVAGRSFQLTDVLFDSAGAFVGILLYRLKLKILR